MRLLAVALLCCTTFIYGQTKQKAIEQLIDQYANVVYSKPDSAYYYISKAVAQSREIRDNFLLSRSLYNLGYHYYLEKQPQNAKKYILEALPYARVSKNNKIRALCYNQLGIIEMEESNYNESLKKLLLALDIAEKNDLEVNRCNALNNLGLLFEAQKDTVKALQYYKQNEAIALKNDLKDILLSSYNNIATLIKSSDKKLSIAYLNKAYRLSVVTDNKYEQFNILINLSYVYLSVGTTASIAKAYSCIAQARKAAIEMGSDADLFFVYFNLGGFYATTKEYNKALEMYEKALAVTPEGNIGEQKANLYKSIVQAYEKIGNDHEAFRYHKLYDQIQDSIFSMEKTKMFNDIQTRYEVEKKNLSITLLTKQKIIEANKRKITLYLGVALIVPLLFALFIYRTRVRTQKIIREKEKLIFEQEKTQLRQEQELKRVLGVLEGQDQERNRIAREIHDGVGGKLAGIRLGLSQINEHSAAKLDGPIGQLSEVFNELRVISHNLSNSNIAEKNLEQLLAELLAGYKHRREFTPHLVVFPDHALLQLPDGLKHQLYRIVQELLANISKHAFAKNVTVSITRHDDVLNLIVEDDGVGFASGKPSGIGLANIRERLFAVDGQMEIESSPKGTTIIIDIPNKT